MENLSRKNVLAWGTIRLHQVELLFIILEFTTYHD